MATQRKRTSFSKQKKGRGKWYDAIRNGGEDVTLSGKSLGCNEAIQIAEALKVNASLLTLDLQWNSIGDNGAKAMAEALTVNASMQTLILCSNKIGAEGAKALADALKVNTSLQVLSLNYNNIGDVGAKAIAEVLKVNTKLQTLYLRDNNIRAIGGKAIADALKVNTSLQELCLRDNHVGDELMAQIVPLLSKEGIIGRIAKAERAAREKQVLEECRLQEETAAAAKERLHRLLLQQTKEDERVARIMLLLDEGPQNEEKADRVAQGQANEIASQARSTQKALVGLYKKDRHQQAKMSANFFSTLLSKKSHNAQTIPEFLENLALLISNVHEMKIFYTFLKAGVAQGIWTADRISAPLEHALQRTAETCGNEDALATFKMILTKCFVDKLLHEHAFHVMDNRAEVKRMSNAAFVLDMKATIERNTRQIEGLNGTVQALKENIRVLDGNIREVHQSLDKLKSGMRFKLKLEATVGMVGAVVNAVTMGIGGNLLQSFYRIIDRVVDYGDAAHIVDVIRTEANPQDAAELESSFQEGVDTAIGVVNKASDMLAQRRLEAALEKGDPLLVLGITASLVNPHQNLTSHQGEIKELYSDAVLSADDEKKFELHAAVKFGDTQVLEELLTDKNVANVINDTDSCQRTAADLAALTGQPAMMEMILSKGGKFSIKSKPRMKALAKKRAATVKEYVQLVESELDD